MTDLKKSLPSWNSADQKLGDVVWDTVHKDLEKILLRAYQAADPTLHTMKRDVLAEEEKKFSFISRGNFCNEYFEVQEKIANRLAGEVDYINYLSQVYSAYVSGLVQSLIRKKTLFQGKKDQLVELLIKSVLSDISVVMYHYFIYLNKQADEARAAAQAERELRAREDHDVINVISQALEALAQGDLTYRIESGMPERVDVLKQNFNTMAAQLEQTMAQISTNTKDVMANADGIRQASDDLSRRTEQQAATLEETSAALTVITQRVRQTTEETRKAHHLVETTQTDAAHSSAIVQNTIEAINQVEQSSNEISGIVGIINDLSFQTNILALNASVEAARAGEVGRGFAVVAHEVRVLAQRSSEAGKEISSLINRSGKQVQSGVTLVRETGASLQRIVDQVKAINDLVSNIALAAQEQAESIGQLNVAMTDMEQTTQKNAAVAEQSAAASHNLAAMSDELASLVAQFHIETKTSYPALTGAPRALSSS
ncbi:methyl-accepting chemotaxis protein [Acetobacter okinawensis]|uniref:methyl-accepting chemotaxis protein n=1 Tax=Acetobacter okinawensis TaxID=1076594 RepID=UPI000470B738|nr:methyl-accepting chemotaxis protein [Acetobacter okinawensis]MBS0966645.1 methyl-accepting chemotaxis protein [Acetobacter okinawensis]MBS0989872.1 methyl-accepting chemotaxis protein [Acetobacter okinawensis]MCP1214075.1 methyl-accepting chemotaxis protein [Acetobacter okinawensis]